MNKSTSHRRRQQSDKIQQSSAPSRRRIYARFVAAQAKVTATEELLEEGLKDHERKLRRDLGLAQLEKRAQKLEAIARAAFLAKLQEYTEAVYTGQFGQGRLAVVCADDNNFSQKNYRMARIQWLGGGEAEVDVVFFMEGQFISPHWPVAEYAKWSRSDWYRASDPHVDYPLWGEVALGTLTNEETDRLYKTLQFLVLGHNYPDIFHRWTLDIWTQILGEDTIRRNVKPGDCLHFGDLDSSQLVHLPSKRWAQCSQMMQGNCGCCRNPWSKHKRWSALNPQEKQFLQEKGYLQ